MNTEIKSAEEILEKIKQRFLSAYYAGFNQAHYSHMHPESFEVKECESAGEEYMSKNEKYVDSDLEEYASQFKQPDISEDVEDAANSYSIKEHGIGNDKQYERGYCYNGFIAGAEWQRQRPIYTVYEEAVKIAKNLAQWSLKYPRDRIYGYNRQPEMDGELIKIEEKAKEWLKNNS